MWQPVRATTTAQLMKVMQKLKETNESSWKELDNLKASSWTKPTYDPNTQCDLQVNNMCEAFNKCILELRGKPIINLVEGIKVYLMMRIVRIREMMLKYCGPTYPKIQLILANIEKDAKAWTLTLCGDDQISLIEVSKNFQKFFF